MRPIARATAVLLLVVAGVSLAGSGSAFEDLGRPACDYCRMIITDHRFGGSLETARGDTLIFDSTECLAAFVLSHPMERNGMKRLRSIPWDWPDNRIDATRAWYLWSDSLPSPMAVNLAAFRRAGEARAARRSHPGELLRWSQVLELVGHRWHLIQGGR